MIRDFNINFSDVEISNIYKRIKDYPWQSMPDIDNWRYGTNFSYIKELCDYWIKEFKWRNFEKKINSFSNYKTNVDGIDIHFIKEKGSSENPETLLLLHGWPGSVVEFLDIIKKLAHPEKYGGNKEDAFTVIAPSLPGFGFSDAPNKPIGPRRMAELLNKMMSENLNYKKYVSQGGDWGATISNWLGYDHSKYCKAIHINCLVMRHPDGPKTDEEKKWQKKFDKDQIMQDGYRIIQATKPQSLSYSMMDSPVGIAAWIIEKFHAWSDLDSDDIESVFSKDVLLSNIMIYVLTKTFNSASWIYFGRREEGGLIFPKEFKKIPIPAGIAIFPKEITEWPPRSYIERIFNVHHWSEFSGGGHFAALEKPDLLIRDLRNFTSKVKSL